MEEPPGAAGAGGDNSNNWRRPKERVGGLDCYVGSRDELEPCKLQLS